MGLRIGALSGSEFSVSAFWPDCKAFSPLAAGESSPAPGALMSYSLELKLTDAWLSDLLSFFFVVSASGSLTCFRATRSCSRTTELAGSRGVGGSDVSAYARNGSNSLFFLLAVSNWDYALAEGVTSAVGAIGPFLWVYGLWLWNLISWPTSLSI